MSEGYDHNRLRYMTDSGQAEQLVREHGNLTKLCNELKSKMAKQRQELAKLNREIEQLRSDKANLHFDLVKERAASAQLREQIRDMTTP